MTHCELQQQLKTLRNEGKIPANFKLNQKKEILAGVFQEYKDNLSETRTYKGITLTRFTPSIAHKTITVRDAFFKHRKDVQEMSLTSPQSKKTRRWAMKTANKNIQRFNEKDVITLSDAARLFPYGSALWSKSHAV